MNYLGRQTARVLPKERWRREQSGGRSKKMTYLPHCYSWFSSRPLIMLQSGPQETSLCEELLHVGQKNESFSG